MRDEPWRTDSNLESLAAGVEELLQSFAAEVGRKPLMAEYCEIMQHALNVVTLDLFADEPGEVALLPWGRGLSSEPYPMAVEVLPDDLDDVVLENAVDLVVLAADLLARTWGSRPSVQAVCDTLCPVLQCFKQPFQDVSADAIDGFKASVSPRRQRRAKVGDIIAIPVGKGEYRFATVVAKNRFGMALGLFEGTGPLRRRPVRNGATLLDLLPVGSHPPVQSRPVYTAEVEVKSGRWRIIGHEETILDLFPRSPEIYHAADPDLPEVGPFGAGETAEETLRVLSEAEAREIGLLDGRYTQTRLPRELEAMQEDGPRTMPGDD